MTSKPDINPEDEMAGSEQPFMSHLIELKDRLTRIIIGIAVVAIAFAIWPGMNNLFNFLLEPLTSQMPTGDTPIGYHVLSPFITPMKVLFMTALFVALPYVLYQIWAFVAPGLYRHERRWILPLVVSSTLLFFSGVAFCYYFVFGKVFAFVLSVAPDSIKYMPDIDSYVGFAINMFLAFGIAFEVPIVVVVLVRMGIVELEKLRSIRGYVIVASFVVAAIVTPPDVISQLALAIPMCLLYEIGLLVSKLVTPKPDNGNDEQQTQSTGS